MEHDEDVREHSVGVDARAAHIAVGQHGLITRAQALRAGLSRSVITVRLRTGRWQPVFRAVYRVGGSQVTWLQRVCAACLAAADGTAAAYDTAATLWGFPGPAVAERIEIVVPNDRSAPRLPGVVVHRPRRLTADDVTVVRGIPVTTGTRTLIDLAGTWSPDALEEALDDALRRRLTTVARIRCRIDDLGSKGRPGAGVLRALLAERTGTPVRSESVFETRLLRALRRAGLPEPTAQFVVRSGGRFVARVDLAFPDARLAIEADGFRHHAGRRRFEHDRARLAALAAAGWRVIPVTWRQLEVDPASVLERVRAALQR